MTISHQVGGPPASAQAFVAATATFNAADHPEVPPPPELQEQHTGQSVLCELAMPGMLTLSSG